MRKLLLTLLFWLAALGAAFAQAITPVQMRDANLTTTSSQNLITTLNTFTAPRTLTLPGRGGLSSYYAQFIDTANAINGANVLNIQMADGGLINGSATLQVTTAGAYLFIIPNSSGYSATVVTGGGGGGTPGGSSGQTQYNNAGAFGGYTMSGDATINTASGAITLATVNANVGTFGSATACVAFTTNGKGLITAASQTTCTPALASVTGFGTGVAAALAINVGSAGSVVVNGGVLGTPSSGSVANLTGFSTAFDTVFGNTQGSILYRNATGWVVLGPGAAGQLLTTGGAGANPTWSTASGTGTVTSLLCDGINITTTGTCPPRYDFVNISLTASVSGNNLTVAMKDNTGADCSATSPCSVWYRDFSTAASSKWAKVDTTAALSFTANAGSTFGVANTTASCTAAASCPFKLWIVAINSGSGTVLGVVNLTNALGVRPLSEAVVQTSTACSACATATAIGTIYSTAAQTTKAIKILGYCEWGSGLATAGTYASTATSCTTLGPGIPRPGEVIQTIYATPILAEVTTTGTTYVSAISASLAPTLASNLVRIHGSGGVDLQPSLSSGSVGLFVATSAISGGTQRLLNLNASAILVSGSWSALVAPGSTSSVSYSIQIRSDGTRIAGVCTTIVASDGCTLTLIEIQG